MRKSIFFLMASCYLFCAVPLCGQSLSHALGSDAYLNQLLDKELLFDTTRINSATAVVVPEETWKEWHVVDNYFYGKNRGSLPMIADLRALHPYFRDKIAQLISICKQEGIDLAIVESYRTPAKQAQYFAMGRKYTNTPGGKSKHQYGLAVDLVPIVDSVAVWNNRRLWRKIGLAGERLGLRWGGRWHVTYDPGHFEWSGDLSRRELEEGSWPDIPTSDADRYADINDALAELQKSWQAWAVEQSSLANSGSTGSEENVGVGN
jgi:hypothetical protein